MADGRRTGAEGGGGEKFVDEPLLMYYYIEAVDWLDNNHKMQVWRRAAAAAAATTSNTEKAPRHDTHLADLLPYPDNPFPLPVELAQWRLRILGDELSLPTTERKGSPRCFTAWQNYEGAKPLCGRGGGQPHSCRGREVPLPTTWFGANELCTLQ